ncbi:hypothetical protein Dda_1938 [Drechslerella dactyloides]|uniref:Uncharacterized protein n=1 Tax=Drechslerella dactyloides TaxID=74499 RepID=A0AAD6J2Z1_DREDA|nr:hypothetical protein Dda_1938 [Drechslerella dactyloides]
MLRYFPPFPSPNPATLDHPPLENAPIIPSPPPSDSSSVSSPRSTSTTPRSTLTTPATPYSPPTSPTSTDGRPRSRSRSAARRCAPPHARIAKRDQRQSSVPRTPPATPPADGENKDATAELAPQPEEEKDANDQEANATEAEETRKKIVRSHRYEDAVRIACGAWGETKPKKKSVSWDKELPA